MWIVGKLKEAKIIPSSKSELKKQEIFLKSFSFFIIFSWVDLEQNKIRVTQNQDKVDKGKKLAMS